MSYMFLILYLNHFYENINLYDNSFLFFREDIILMAKSTREEALSIIASLWSFNYEYRRIQ